MSRRERLQRKLEKRQEWADKAMARSDAHYQTGHKMFDAIPMGQPILIGHHSEKRDRNYRERAGNHMSKFVAERKLAQHHESKADGLAAQLDQNIYSDDNNAVEALEARIAEREAERERMKRINALYRKGDAEALAALGFNLEALREKLKTAYSWCQQPYPGYELQNLGGRITADRKRLEYVKQQSARRSTAEASPNGVTLEHCQMGYCRVTFAEKPDRSILNALRAADFRWGSGSWAGKEEKLPQEVKEMLDEEHSEPTWANQLAQARKMLREQGREALENPSADIGRKCGCNQCFTCAAAFIVAEYDKRPDIFLWDHDIDNIPVQVVGKDWHKAFANLHEAQKEFPMLEPHKGGGEFTWAMYGEIDGKPALRFETGEAYQFYST